MLIFDQIQSENRPLRLVALGFLLAMGLLVAGLWYLQIMSSKRYAESAKTQSVRNVRFPALRGNILDSQGRVLAECRPSYNIVLYLNELSRTFQQEYKRQRGSRKLSREESGELARHVRYTVVSNAVQELGTLLRQPLWLKENKFHQHYEQRRALPLPVMMDVTTTNIAIFLEQPNRPPGFDLEIQPLRSYPNGSLAAHLLGYLRRDEATSDDDENPFTYHLPDFKGLVGIEGVFDAELRGKAGGKSVLVNNMGYRISDHIWSAAEPGQNLVLTIDARIQQAAEQALRNVGGNVKGAAVVLDPRNGDILALASSPPFNPNSFIPYLTPEEEQKLNEGDLLPLINRATYGSYAPGSIFKIIIALTCLEANTLDPKEIFHSPGFYQLGRRTIDDLAPRGDYDFIRAFKLSSNTYFITHGLKAGFANILNMGHRFHLGERTEMPLLQEVSGFFPTDTWLKRRRAQGDPWRDGDTANLCIGQGDITVTPLQMAIMTAAIANGGRIYWPRLVERMVAPDPFDAQQTQTFPPGRVRSELGVSAGNLALIRDAMLADVEEEGTGKRAFVPGLQVCGKTGTAQVKQNGHLVRHDAWFVSFAPYDHPRCVVVVLIEGGGSGGGTSAPVAQKIYQAFQRRESQTAAQGIPLALSVNDHHNR
jgi:penicillin-binding protein 2